MIAISCVKEKASVSASVTVEAVLCVPLFLYAAVSLIWMLELRSIQSAVRCGLQSAGKQVAESFAEIPVLNPISLHADLVNAVGKERMDRSMIVGGSGGVSCKRSWAIPGMGVHQPSRPGQKQNPFSWIQWQNPRSEVSTNWMILLRQAFSAYPECRSSSRAS